MNIQVSPEDEWLLAAYPWYVHSTGYAQFSKKMAGKNIVFLLHRVIKNAQPGTIVDHVDGNPLNNRHENLRFCTHTENMQNRKAVRNSATGVKGVTFIAGRKRPYKAEIKSHGDRFQLGYFEHVGDAALAYRLAAIHHHGEFARFN